MAKFCYLPFKVFSICAPFCSTWFQTHFPGSASVLGHIFSDVPSVVRCLESFDFKHPHLDDLAGADKNPGLCPNDAGARTPLLIQSHLEDFSTAPFILLRNHDAMQNFTYIVSASPLITCSVLPFRLFLFCPAK